MSGLIRRMFTFFLAVAVLITLIPAYTVFGKNNKKTDANDKVTYNNEIIVKYKEDVKDEKVKDKVKEKIKKNKKDKKLKTKEKIKFKKGEAELLEVDTKEDVAQIIEELEADPSVEFAEPNYDLYITANDPDYGEQWGLKNKGQAMNGQTGTYGVDINISPIRSTIQGSSNIIVAVLDTGMDVTHEDLKDNIFVNDKESANGMDSDGNGVIDDLTGGNFCDKNNNLDRKSVV